MRFLCIKAHEFVNRPWPTTFLLDQFTNFTVGGEGRFGTLDSLEPDERAVYARWCAQMGGKGLLDAFELGLMNCHRQPLVRPLGSWPEVSEWSARRIVRDDAGGVYIRWSGTGACPRCEGTGDSDEDDEDDDGFAVCSNCDGSGEDETVTLWTDMDGAEVPLGDDL